MLAYQGARPVGALGVEGYYNQGMGNATIMVYEAVIKIAEGRVVRFEIED